MYTRNEMLWNTLYMHYVQPNNTMYVHLGDGRWGADEVQEYMARRIHRGDFGFANEEFAQEAYLEWSTSLPETSLSTTFQNAFLKAPCIFGIYSYRDEEVASEAGLRFAEKLRDDLVEANHWTTTPQVKLSEPDEEDKVEPGVLDMRLDLLSASTGRRRTFPPLSNMTKLLEWDDAVGEAFEYLLGIQQLPNISEADYREASHLLHRVSLHRRSLMTRIRRDGIHVESDPDGNVA